MAREASSKSGSTSPILSRLAACDRSSPRTVGVLSTVRPGIVAGPGVRTLTWLLGNSMFLLVILPGPVGMFESERFHRH